MKLYITLAGALLAVLNGLLLFPATNAYTFQIAAIAFVLALLILALSFASGNKKTATPVVAQEPANKAAIIQPPAPAPPAENQAESEIVAFFAL